jgi:hypothetical protein
MDCRLCFLGGCQAHNIKNFGCPKMGKPTNSFFLLFPISVLSIGAIPLFSGLQSLVSGVQNAKSMGRELAAAGTSSQVQFLEYPGGGNSMHSVLEPGSMVLLGTILLAIGFAIRRSRRSTEV